MQALKRMSIEKEILAHEIAGLLKALIKKTLQKRYKYEIVP